MLRVIECLEVVNFVGLIWLLFSFHSKICLCLIVTFHWLLFIQKLGTQTRAASVHVTLTEGGRSGQSMVV